MVSGETPTAATELGLLDTKGFPSLPPSSFAEGEKRSDLCPRPALSLNGNGQPASSGHSEYSLG